MENKVRVRFAPSPTGALHIGGVRTALYNYLFAKKNNGVFILRVEDTDRTRYVRGAEDYIVESMNWLGLHFDESPNKGGAYGPYRQSDRQAAGIYDSYAKTLIENGWGYYAFDTPEELDHQRQLCEKQGETFKYDATTRVGLKNSLTLSVQEVSTLIQSGAPYVIRLKVPDREEIIVEDMIRGLVRFDANVLDDKVMLKADGMPTYHLANVIDDYSMRISHVIRGEEWLPSTPIHTLIYEGLGLVDHIPQFAHLPLILKPDPAAFINKKTRGDFSSLFASELVAKDDGLDQQKVEGYIQTLFQDIKSISQRLKINEKKDVAWQVEVKSFLRSTLYGKLSKRDGSRLGMPVFPLNWTTDTGDVLLKGFREWGFLPQALINILVLLGWNDGTDKEVFTLKELIDSFSMERVTASGAKFNFEKAKWFNKTYIQQLTDEQFQALFSSDERFDDSNMFESICFLMKERLTFLTEWDDKTSYFNQIPEASVVIDQYRNLIDKKFSSLWEDDRIQFVNTFIEQLEQLDDWSDDQLRKVFDGVDESISKMILPFTRLAVTASSGGPDMIRVMQILGKKSTIKRLSSFASEVMKNVNAN